MDEAVPFPRNYDIEDDDNVPATSHWMEEVSRTFAMVTVVAIGALLVRWVLSCFYYYVAWNNVAPKGSSPQPQRPPSYSPSVGSSSSSFSSGGSPSSSLSKDCTPGSSQGSSSSPNVPHAVGKDQMVVTGASASQSEPSSKPSPNGVEVSTGGVDAWSPAVSAAPTTPTPTAKSSGTHVPVNLTKKMKKARKQAAEVARQTAAQEREQWQRKTTTEKVRHAVHTVPTFLLHWGNATRSSVDKAVRTHMARLVGQYALTKEDVDAPLQRMREQLLEKNVTPAVTDMLVSALETDLIGKTLGTFERLVTLVHTSMARHIRTLVAPQHAVPSLPDHWLGTMQRKRELQPNEPYSVVVLGANGVGKSTTLAKLCVFLQSHGHQCSLAAADTFRAGAVEQLQTHARALGIRLYEHGYHCDPAKVAKTALFEARYHGDDVVLIDSAGRMHNNGKLMHELGHLVDRVHPDCVLFVGEALVGNDGVAQVEAFHQRLQPRGVDYLVLTKFDTVDTKIGTVLNMMAATQLPVLFVGVGQTYRDLRELDAETIVQFLLQK